MIERRGLTAVICFYCRPGRADSIGRYSGGKLEQKKNSGPPHCDAEDALAEVILTPSDSRVDNITFVERSA